MRSLRFSLLTLGLWNGLGATLFWIACCGPERPTLFLITMTLSWGFQALFYLGLFGLSWRLAHSEPAQRPHWPVRALYLSSGLSLLTRSLVAFGFSFTIAAAVAEQWRVIAERPAGEELGISR